MQVSGILVPLKSISKYLLPETDGQEANSTARVQEGGAQAAANIINFKQYQENCYNNHEQQQEEKLKACYTSLKSKIAINAYEAYSQNTVYPSSELAGVDLYV